MIIYDIKKKTIIIYIGQYLLPIPGSHQFQDTKLDLDTRLI